MTVDITLRDRVLATYSGFTEALTQVMLDRHNIAITTRIVDRSLTVTRTDGEGLTFEQTQTIDLFEIGYLAALRSMVTQPPQH